MKWLVTVILIFGGMAISSNSPVERDHMPNPDGKALWNYITETNNYENWDQWPGYNGLYEGQSPHGAFLKLYINDAAKQAISNGKKTLPANAIIVKENYNKQKKMVAVTPMYKVKNYNPEAGDWFWAKYSAKGDIQAEGKVGSCINCHSDMKDKDYLFSWK